VSPSATLAHPGLRLNTFTLAYAESSILGHKSLLYVVVIISNSQQNAFPSLVMVVTALF
jgi:hypothetical protein